MMKSPINHSHLLPAIGIVSIFIIFGLYSATDGVRGTDQYWYVDQVTALLEGRGPVSNNIYPVSAFGNAPKLPRPFVQNFPIVYIVSVIAMLTGSFWGWIITNLLCSILTALIISRTVHHLTKDYNAALFSGLFYILLPVTFWNTVQPLSEPFLGLLTSIAVYVLIIYPANIKKFFILSLIAGLLYLSRKSYILLFPIIVGAFIFFRGFRKKDVSGAVALILIMLSFVLAAKIWFPTNVDRSLFDFLMACTEKYPSNMLGFYNIEGTEFLLSQFLAKVYTGLKIQITGDDFRLLLLFYVPFNLCIMAIFIQAFRVKEIHSSLLSAAIFFFIYICSVMVFQNQFRYQLMAWPAIIVAMFHYFRCWFIKPSILKKIVCVCVVLSATSVFFIASNQLKSNAVKDAQIVSEIKQQVKKIIPQQDIVMVICDNGRHALIGHAFWPQLVLFAKTNQPNDVYEQLAKNTNCRWILCEADTVKWKDRKLVNNILVSQGSGRFQVYQ